MPREPIELNDDLGTTKDSELLRRVLEMAGGHRYVEVWQANCGLFARPADFQRQGGHYGTGRLLLDSRPVEEIRARYCALTDPARPSP